MEEYYQSGTEMDYSYHLRQVGVYFSESFISFPAALFVLVPRFTWLSAAFTGWHLEDFLALCLLYSKRNEASKWIQRLDTIRNNSNSGRGTETHSQKQDEQVLLWRKPAEVEEDVSRCVQAD